MPKISIRPLSKLACAEGFEGDAERRTAAYSNIREDSSTASTYKSPAEVEFRRRSINKIYFAISRIHDCIRFLGRENLNS
ncbi:palindromic element RPE1 domain-containing protein [Candidatus Tisiphia endosymbiont of Empis tessellata]|uniref:palindromic element RPE1 domain-containing protein n=1 Tax=Candidatus Tisiphia endosymbiont of Empis tessellata TaxID=3066259 RepID=UPI00313F19CE